MRALPALLPALLPVLLPALPLATGVATAHAESADIGEVAIPLTISASFSQQQDSNLLRLPEGANTRALTGRDSAADSVAVSSLGLKFSTRQSLQELELGVDWVDYKYQQFDYLSYTATNYNAAWRWALTPQLTGSLSSERRESLNSFADAQNYSVRNQRVDSSTRLDAAYALDGPWRLLFGAASVRQTNQQAVVAGADSSSTQAEAGLRYVFASNSSVSLKTRVSEGSYQNRAVPNTSLLDSQFRQTEHELRLRWNASGNSTAEFYLGHLSRTHPNYGVRDYRGFNSGASLNWTLSGKTALVAAYSHALAAFASANANYTQTDTISLAPVWNISPKTTARLQHQWSQVDYLGNPGALPASTRVDTLQDTSLTLDWQPTRSLSLRTSAQRLWRGSTQAGVDYASNLFSIAVQYSY